jgi:hypothetical protein
MGHLKPTVITFFFSKDREQRFWLFNGKKIQNPPLEEKHLFSTGLYN